MGKSTDFFLDVYNQPLFEYPDTKDMSYAILYGIMNDEDIVTHMKRAMMANLNMGQIRRFNTMLSDGTYAAGHANAGVSLAITATEDIVHAIAVDLELAVEEGEGEEEEAEWSIDFVHAGHLRDIDWIFYVLANEAPQQEDFYYETISDGGCPGPGTVTINGMGSIEEGDVYGKIFAAFFGSDGIAYVAVSWSQPSDEAAEMVSVFPTNVAPTPLDVEVYIAGVKMCTQLEEGGGNGGDGGVKAGEEPKTETGGYVFWMYDPRTGEHPSLTLGEFHFGSEVGFTECFPPIPLRLQNVNYDEGDFVDPDEADKILKTFGIKPALVLDAVMGSADENPDITEDMLDNVYANFGVRIWDRSEAGRQYLYTFFAEVLKYLIEAGSTEEEPVECAQTAIIEETEGGEEVQYKKPKGIVDPDETEGFGEVPMKDCSMIMVRTEHSKYNFYFSVIINEFYDMGAVHGDPILSQIYNSDKGKFYSSSGELLMPAGYSARTLRDVEAFTSGGGKKANRHIAEGEPGWDHMRPEHRIKHAAGGEDLIPENVYDRSLSVVEFEIDEDVRQITYYCVEEHGIDAITVYGIGASMLVQDAESFMSGMIMLDTAKSNQITVPFMFGLIENVYDDGQMHDKVDSCVCSLHITMCMAKLIVTETPWWMTLVKVIMFVIAVIAFYFGQFYAGTFVIGEFMTAVGMVGLMYMVAMIVFKIASAFGFWGQVIAAVGMFIVGAYQQGITSLASLLTKSLDKLLLIAMDIVIKVARLAGAFLQKSRQEDFLETQESHLEELDELKKAGLHADYDEYSNVVLAAIYGTSSRTVLDPIDPAAYFDKVDNFNNIGFMLYDIDNVYEMGNELPGMT